MADDTIKDDPVAQEEPDMDTAPHAGPDQPDGIWMRGLYMIIFGILFAVAETVLVVLAILQFCWMLFAKKRNVAIAQFGGSLSKWLGQVAAFQSGASDDKPFPWASWGD